MRTYDEVERVLIALRKYRDENSDAANTFRKKIAKIVLSSKIEALEWVTAERESIYAKKKTGF